MKRTAFSLGGACIALVAVCVLGASDAQAWVRKNLRDVPGRANINLKAPAGRLAFEVERKGSLRIDDGSDLAAIRAAMRSLSDAPGASVTVGESSNFDFPSNVGSRDGLKLNAKNQIYFFREHDAAFPAVAVTAYFYNTATGEIAEADIALNEADYTFTTSTPSDPNTPLGSRTADLQEVVTHELMHALGFEHTPMVGRFDPDTGRQVAGYTSGDYSNHATMFPIATQTVQGRSLSDDDKAALRAVYGSTVASISGHVVDGATGRGVKGAHVVVVRADDLGAPVVGTITGTGSASGPGEFLIEGLPEGNYYLRIEPLAGGSNPFVQGYTSYTGFDTSFKPEFYSGGAESAVDTDIQAADAAMITISSNARLESVTFVTNVEMAPPSVAGAEYKGGKLKVTGSGFVVGATEIEIDGVTFGSLKFPAKHRLANGTATRFICKDTSLAAATPAGATIVVVNTATGERSAPVVIQQ